MSGFAVLNASTMWASTSESGGVWLVQNLTTVAVAVQLAPVTGVGSALAPAACDAAAEAEAAGAEAAGCDASRRGDGGGGTRSAGTTGGQDDDHRRGQDRPAGSSAYRTHGSSSRF